MMIEDNDLLLYDQNSRKFFHIKAKHMKEIEDVEWKPWSYVQVPVLDRRMLIEGGGVKSYKFWKLYEDARREKRQATSAELIERGEQARDAVWIPRPTKTP